MSLILESGSSTRLRREKNAIEIALLNNLGDAGLEGGERQFAELLQRAAGTRRIRLRLFSLPTIHRGASARARIATHYEPFDSLFARPLDGLIITGCEPRADHLEEESYWVSLCEVMETARAATRSTLFSCLAAHAAVLHFDGIRRRPRKSKLSGLYPVEVVSSHPLVDGLGTGLRVPHSRWNGLDEVELTSAGYEILTRGSETGVDTFVKEDGSLMVFLQGHPEYDPEALFREYRRDVLRYLDRSAATYPCLPEHAVSAELAAELDAFAQIARRDRHLERFATFPSVRRGAFAKSRNDAFAVRFYANWLDLLHHASAEHAA